MLLEIMGHKEQIEKLKKIVKTDKVANAYIFEGMSGIGKCTVAKEFAKALLCLSEGSRPCNEYIACKTFEDSNNFILLAPEGNVIKVDSIRALKEELMLKPITSDRKVAIINDAECMNEQAQNALLKILEEPPKYVTIILITSNKEKLLYTIKSRCISFQFQPLKEEELRAYFEEPIEKELLEYARGSIGAIVNAKENHATEAIAKWVQAFRQESLIELMRDVNEVREEKYVKDHLQDFLEYLLYLYYKDMKEKKQDTTGAIAIVEETRNHILRNANVDIALDRMVINLWKWRRECKRLLV